MSSPPLDANTGSSADAETLQRLSEALDRQDFSNGGPHLDLVPVGPGRFHAHWSLSEQLINEGCAEFGLPRDQTKLALRAFEFGADQRDFHHAAHWEDFTIQTGAHSGYFNVPNEPAYVGAAVGLVNEHGHFRPLLRAESIALPQSPSLPASEPQANEAEPSEPTDKPLDESGILARLPALDGLPAELLSAPERFITAPELAAYALASLDESAIHAAALSGQLSSEAALAFVNERARVTSAPTTRPLSTAGSSEYLGASENLASQWSTWGIGAPLSLRAEVAINGKIEPGYALSVNGQPVGLLPGRTFKAIWKTTNFVEIWPLLTGEKPEAGAATWPPVITAHAVVSIEGRINEPNYEQFLPPEAKPDAQGRFVIDRSLPPGAILLPQLEATPER